MHLTFYGHSCFSVRIGATRLLFDPFVTPNRLANNIVNIDTIGADFIFLSHGHHDHIADCVRVATQTGAKVICNVEIEEWLYKQEVTNIHAMSCGGKWNFGSFAVKCTASQHSSGLPDGSYGGNAMGFIITSDEGNFYYSGDTSLTMDMQLIPRWAKLNFAVLPIGDNFTMDAADAAACAQMIGCKQVVGVHYDTFNEIKINPATAISVFSDAGVDLRLVKIGESISI